MCIHSVSTCQSTTSAEILDMRLNIFFSTEVFKNKFTANIHTTQTNILPIIPSNMNVLITPQLTKCCHKSTTVKKLQNT